MIEEQRPLSLTPEAYQLAATYQLGMPTTEYKPGFSTSKIIGIVTLLVLIVGSIVLGIISSQLAVFLIIAGSSFALLLFVLGDTFLSRDKRVYVCPGGLLYLHGKITDAIRWDQVEAVWQRVVRRSSFGIKGVEAHLYTLRRNDGATFKFDDHLDNVAALGNTIVSETASLLWSRSIAAYQAGQTVAFGRLSLNQQGVSYGKVLLPWQQVKGIQTKQGFIYIQKEGNPSRSLQTVAASQIPNFNVFMALVDSILNSGRR